MKWPDVRVKLLFACLFCYAFFKFLIRHYYCYQQHYIRCKIKIKIPSFKSWTYLLTYIKINFLEIWEFPCDIRRGQWILHRIGNPCLYRIVKKIHRSRQLYVLRRQVGQHRWNIHAFETHQRLREIDRCLSFKPSFVVFRPEYMNMQIYIYKYLEIKIEVVR